jgi:hypothetical protein
MYVVAVKGEHAVEVNTPRSCNHLQQNSVQCQVIIKNENKNQPDPPTSDIQIFQY